MWTIFTIKYFFHLIAIRVTDLRIDESSTSLREYYALHSPRVLGGFDDVLG
jgi:hypothetical protein